MEINGKDISWQTFFSLGIPILFIPTLLDIEYPLIFSYETHKALHIFGAILFVGNILVTAIWMTLAQRSSQQEVVLFAANTTDDLDIYFTAPGALLLLLNGLIMADSSFGGPFNLNWMRDSVLSFIITAVIWVIVLVPNQVKMKSHAQDAANTSSPLPPEFSQSFKKWLIWGTIAIILSFVIIYLMTTKPDY